MNEDMWEYRPRFVLARPVLAAGVVRIKPYEIYISNTAEPRLHAAQWRTLLHTVFAPAPPSSEEQAGFAIAHFASDGDYLLVSTWYRGNMLKHEVRALSRSRDEWSVDLLRARSIIACVWELAVLSFERDAWIRTAMAQAGSAASIDKYLSCRLGGFV